ncbi:MAG: hypothetical protein ABSC13_06480 [Dehalococcoidia bacterium]|jgi:hypothetical protein
MARKVSPRTYRTEAAFRREAERRLRDRVPDHIWEETGESIWREHEIERGYAVEAALDFALTELRHKRKTGELPPPPQQISRDPQDAQLWRLRSRVLARRVETYAGEWRRRFLPDSLDAGSFTHSGEDRAIVKKAREGPLEPDEFGTWIRLLTEEREGCFLAEPFVPDAPLILVESSAPLSLSFPSSTRPSFLEPDRLPANWWSGSDRDNKTGIRILALPTSGSAWALHASYWGERILQVLVDEAKWVGSGNWSLAETVGFFLFGAIPLLGPLRAAIRGAFDETGWGARITLTLDPRVGSHEVEAFYRELRRDRELRLRPAIAAKGYSSRVGTLLEFVLARWQPGSNPEWSDLWREWQESHGRSRGWTYASPPVMARVVKRALAVLEKELRPAY